ncbi:MAG: phenylacetate--CoA ligase family protein [Rubrivivax sp.]|nr:phenylacetate--CoA ligase family protein [Rubrivivax sp.]
MMSGPFATAGRPSPASMHFEVLSATRATAAEITQLQRSRLLLLLQAAQRAPLYHRLLHGRDLTSLPLEALPVMDKVQLMAHFADTCTEPDITLDELREFCADPSLIGQPFRGHRWAWESSGSTGQPGLFVHDETAMAVYDALEACRRHAPRPWARFLDPLGLAERWAFVGAVGGHFASVVTVRRLCALQPWLGRNWRCFSILQPTPALVDELNDFAPTVLATYPTAAVMLAGEAQCGRLRCRPKEVWTGGETLSQAMRACIAQAFGAELRNSYGASEFLPIAWECAQRRLHVNADWVILEAVDAQHRPVPPGTLSHTTLLTNLANHLQPLIRFDIGDRIVLGGECCPCGSALPVIQVQGRSDDMLVVAGRGGEPVTLLPLALSTVLEDEAGVFDFQLRQTGPQALELLLGPGAPTSAAVREHCRRSLVDFGQAQGAAGLKVAVRSVHSLPLGHSGKLKRIVAASGAPATLRA